MYSTGIQGAGQNQLYNITPAANPTTNPNPNAKGTKTEEEWISHHASDIGEAMKTVYYGIKSIRSDNPFERGENVGEALESAIKIIEDIGKTVVNFLHDMPAEP